MDIRISRRRPLPQLGSRRLHLAASATRPERRMVRQVQLRDLRHGTVRRLDRLKLRDHDAAMRVVGATLLLILAATVLTAWRPEAASACSGRNLDLRDAIGLSDGPIYA